MQKKSTFREYAEAILIAGVCAFFIRSFVLEAFKIPSSSMVPTLLIGDHIFVNKFIYGLRIPLTKKWVAHFREPRRGEVVVFIYPKDERKDFIKRVIGLPGDTIRVAGRDLYVNGELLPKEVMPVDQAPPVDRAHLDYFFEMVDGERHFVQHEKQFVRDGSEYVVPARHLFVMGDNRDGSADSRDWGFVPMENLKGKAMFIWLSWNSDATNVRWNRFGRWIR